MSDSFDSEIIKEQDKRIRELEAERDEWKAKYESEVRLVDSVEAERDAIRAKTIEECAGFLESRKAPGLAYAIRALAQTDEK
jgi:hypothetical protein